MTVGIDHATMVFQRLEERPEYMVMTLHGRRTWSDTARTAFFAVPEVSWSTFTARAGHTAGRGGAGGVS
ncbi:hypothetical protein [Streptosporangium sp. LJ11]|uniref:hypothetical protein n=1 Tax=Streptosporangium sp. LJ11 TaxID=3436927 RepID=UPI003F7AD63E